MALRPTENVNLIQSSEIKFTQLNNLSRGAKILFATDDFFAAAENLFKEGVAEWKEGVFDDAGKWMDGWETRRKRIPGHDFALIKLRYPSVIAGIHLDTSFFTGNYTPKISLQAANLSSQEEALIPPRREGNNKAATLQEIMDVGKIHSEEWMELVPKTKLGSGYVDTCDTLIPVQNKQAWTHLRLNYFPDGGVARLVLYGRVDRSPNDILNDDKAKSLDGLINLIGMESGGICIGFSNAHYGHPRNMILSTNCPNIGNGWETARRLDRPDVISEDKEGFIESVGNYWAAFKLGLKGKISKVEIDTACFIGNYPDSCKVEYLLNEGEDEEDLCNAPWKTLVPKTKLGPNKSHEFDVEYNEKISHVRLTIAPDGGIARFRVWGLPV